MLTLLLASLSTVQASGYFYSDTGISGMRRGGANVAGADDLSALWFNPAALKRIDGNRVDIDVSLVDHSVRFTRASESMENAEGGMDVTSFDPVENSAAPFPIPAFALSSDLGTDRLQFALGFHTPLAAPLHNYDEAGAQRYNLVSSEMIQASIAPGLSYEVNDWLTLGGSLTANLLRIKQDLDVHMFLPLPGFDVQGTFGDTAGDVGFALAASDPFLVSGNIGLLVEPEGGVWAIGLSGRPGTTYTATGSIVADFSNHFLYAPEDPTKQIVLEESVESDMQLVVNLPPVLKAGLLVRPTEALELEFGFVWEGWSVNESLVVEGINFSVPTTLSPTPVEVKTDVVLPTGFKDAYSVRFGGQYQASDTLSLSAGGFYESSAVPTSSLGLGQVDTDKIGYGAGVSVALNEAVELELGFGQIFLESATVTDSEIEAVMVDAISGEVEEDGAIVGNGIYESSLMMGGFALSWAFGN